jgi:hypothetical protein
MATAEEKFPRIRDDSFNLAGMFHIPMAQNGRLDQVIGDLYGTPTMYKAFAAANNIRNAMRLRPTIRISSEAIHNELVLKGYKGADLVRAEREANEQVVLGNRDWLGYGDAFNGVITEATGDDNYVTPSPDSVMAWYMEYNEVKEDDE